MEPHGITSGLPHDYALVHFHSFRQIKAAARQLLDALVQNQGCCNQFIAVLSLSETARKRLDNEKGCLDGIFFRFMWEGNTGLIKVIPTAEHGCVTQAIQSEIEAILRFGMGIPRSEVMFGMSTTHQPTVENKGNQPDGCFWPPLRQPGPGRPHGWPTLAIETGVTESLQRLREDANWSFHNSLGEVRIVLLVSIDRRRRKTVIEKWQLAPPGTPNPMTGSILNQVAN